MTVIEGRGAVAPSPVTMPIDASELRVLYAEAKRRYEFRQYGNRPDVWGKGLITKAVVVDLVGEQVKPGVLPILIGLVGEYAVGRYIIRAFPGSTPPVDLDLLINGDGGRDFRVYGFSLDIKTRKRDYSENLVRQYSAKADAFVFCEWQLNAVVKLVGWQYRDAVRRWDLHSGFGGKHMNHSAPDDALLPLSRLVDELKVRKEMESL